MAADRSPQPPKEAWERRKHVIRRWYLTENRTCEDIQRTLENEGFKVSERQIKNRLSEWKFERKKTPFQQYVAMLVVADYYKSCGVDIDFEVPKREERVTYTTQKVRKECERVKKRYATRGQPLHLPSLSHAQAILEQNKISWSEKHLVVRPNVFEQDHPYNGLLSPLYAQPQVSPPTNFSLGAANELVPVQDSRFPVCTNVLEQESCAPVSSLPPCSSCSNWQIHLESMSYDNSAAMPMAEGVDTPMSIHTPETVYTHTSTFSPSLRRSQRTVPILQFDASSMTSNFAPDFNHTALVQWPSSTVSPHAPILRPLPAVGSQSSVTSLADFEEESQETSTAVVKWSRSEFTICRRCSPPHSHRDFDFNESIDSLENKFPLAQTDYLDMRTFSGNARLDEHLSAELHKLTASQWAAPCYMQCSKDARRDALERSKAHSMDALQYALEHNNEFILPALSWVILVLGQTERKQLLAHFLRDSCALIDRQPRVRRSFTYATPFRYAWAWARDDEEDMNRVGDDLERSHIQIGQIWGTEHPNYFVSGYLFAWHLIRKGEYDKAIRMLTESLPVCERRMGRHDLLTVSCLAVVSRAHSEIGNLRLAVEYCQRAMAATELLVADQHRSEVHQVHRPVLKRFSLELLERRASLTLHLRDHLSAEKQMWRVLHLRGHLDGLDSGGTWSAAQKLGPMLEGRGYTAASEKLMNFIRERYRWEQLNAWYREDAKTRQPPPQPPAPPCWWPFRRKDGQMGCPACPDTQPEAEQSYNFSTRRIQSRHHLDPCFGMLLDTEC